MAVNLGSALARRGDALLISGPGDGSHDLALWFSLPVVDHEKDIARLAQASAPELLDAAAEKVEEHLYVLRGTAWDSMDAGRFTALALKRFSWVVMDAGVVRPGRWLEEAKRFIPAATDVLVIFNPDPLSTRKVGEAAEILKSAGRRLRCIRNRGKRGNEGAPAVGEWADLLGGVEFLAGIAEAREMQDAMLRARTVAGVDSRSDTAGEFVYLAELLSRSEAVSAGETPPPGDDAFLSPLYRKLKRKLHRRLLDRMRERGGEHSTRGPSEVADEIAGVVEEEGLPALTPGFRDRLVKDLGDEVLGLGPLQDLIDDPGITEVMVNGPNDIYVERDGRLSRVSLTLDGDEEVRNLIERIVAPLGRRIDESSPLVDARLPDGSRVNAIIPPLALGGPCLTIRKFAGKRLTMEDLIRIDSLTDAASGFLHACVAGRINILISGGTGSGKTTLLNIIASFIGVSERIVTIEDAAELRLPQDHVVRLESRPASLEGTGAITIRDLVRNALRMRPDRIVVGECRGGEALDMLQAMNTGHEGSISTLHANSPRDALARLETMVLMAGMDLPLRAIREQIASAVEVVVHISRMKDGSRKVTRIAEVTGMEGDVYRMQDIFARRGEGALEPAGLVPRVAEKLEERGQEVKAELFS